MRMYIRLRIYIGRALAEAAGERPLGERKNIEGLKPEQRNRLEKDDICKILEYL
jgi:hypothetical protein